MLYITSHTLRDRVGLAVNEAPGARAEQQQTLEHIKRIWHILQETPGFDPVQLAPHIPQLLLKPEVQHMGQASRLAQRTIARSGSVNFPRRGREAREELRELGKRVEQSPNQITQILAQSPR